jgi:hypothetical protein
MDFSGNSVKWRGREVGLKYVFLGLRRQLCCLDEGRNKPLVLHCQIAQTVSYDLHAALEAIIDFGIAVIKKYY